MKRAPKLPMQSVGPMDADSVQGPAAAPAMAPKPTMMAPPAAAPRALPQKTHNPANLLPPHAFHGKKR